MRPTVLITATAALAMFAMLTPNRPAAAQDDRPPSFPGHVWSAIADDDAITYDDTEIPQMAQVGHNQVRRLWTWEKAGGFQNGITTKKHIALPDGEQAIYWATQHEDGGWKWAWVYPIGTVLTEALFWNTYLEPFEIRALERTANGWKPYVERTGAMPPPDYETPTNCLDCHRQTGNRGSDGIHSFHPFRAEGRTAQPEAPFLEPRRAGLFRERRENEDLHTIDSIDY